MHNFGPWCKHLSPEITKINFKRVVEQSAANGCFLRNIRLDMWPSIWNGANFIREFVFGKSNIFLEMRLDEAVQTICIFFHVSFAFCMICFVCAFNIIIDCHHVCICALCSLSHTLSLLMIINQIVRQIRLFSLNQLKLTLIFIN